MEDNSSPWQYKPEDGANPDAPEDTPAPSTSKARPKQPAVVSWRAAEFVEHPHSAGWYGLLVLVTAGLTALVYFTTKDYFATGTIPVMGIIVGIFVGHKPDIVQYEITNSGISVNGRAYPFSLFKSFSVLPEGSLSSVNLFPLKRFMPPVTAYFDPSEQEKIVQALGDYLPYEEHQMDGIDRLTRRLRL